MSTVAHYNPADLDTPQRGESPEVKMLRGILTSTALLFADVGCPLTDEQVEVLDRLLDEHGRQS